MPVEAGKCYSGMPNEVYHGLKEWFGSSMLKHTRRSVEYFYYKVEQPPETTLALERGSAFHVAMEGLATTGTLDMFKEKVLECPTATINSKAFAELKSENPGCYVLPEKELEKCEAMALKSYQKASRSNYFTEGWPELSLFWIDPLTGIKCKARPDWFRKDKWGGYIFDYKTAKDHTLDTFSREIVKRDYHFSAAMYIDGVEQVMGIEDTKFLHLVINNTPPYEVVCYEIGWDSLREGKALFDDSLQSVKNYKPSKEIFIMDIEIPPWAFKLTDKDNNF